MIKQVFPEINETLEAIIFDKSLKTILKVPVSDIVKKISDTNRRKIISFGWNNYTKISRSCK